MMSDPGEKATPNVDRDRIAKELILDIIACQGDEFEGKTRLYKAFYYSHLFYWKDTRGILTDYPIVRMPEGHGVHEGSRLLRELEEEGEIVVRTRPKGPYMETRFALARSRSTSPEDPRIAAIRRALDWIEGRSAAELSAEIHEHSRSWRQAEDGDVLDIYADLLSDDEYEELVRRTERAKEWLDAVKRRR
jgi:hypothetical protein